MASWGGEYGTSEDEDEEADAGGADSVLVVVVSDAAEEDSSTAAFSGSLVLSFVVVSDWTASLLSFSLHTRAEE